MIGRLFGLGTTDRGVGQAVGEARVFLGNCAARDATEHERFNRVLAQFSKEFVRSAGGRFDGFVNGLNRLPRPMMAHGTLILFAYAMADPQSFAMRMQGLGYVPEPLWWLLGAVVSFYFGARALHHYRGRRFNLPLPPAAPCDEAPLPPVNRPAEAEDASAVPVPSPAPTTTEKSASAAGPAASAPTPAVTDPDYNAAFEEWRRSV